MQAATRKDDFDRPKCPPFVSSLNVGSEREKM